MKQTPKTIKAAIDELRDFIDHDGSDPLEVRIAHETETMLRWATENTVDWPGPLQSARDTATMIRQDIKAGRIKA